MGTDGASQWRGEADPARHPRPWHMLALYLACLLGAGYAQLMATIPGTGISIWLPSGLLMGALLANHRASWIWWIASAGAAELTGNLFWFGNSLPVALLILIGNIAESVVGALLIGRLVGWPFKLKSIKDALGLVFLGAILAPLVAATVGGLTLMGVEGQRIERAVSLFWIGDATGVLVAAPALVTVVDAWRRGTRPALDRMPEAAVLILAIGLVAAASLSGRLPFGLIFIPLVLIAAARFYFWGSAISAVGLTLLIAGFQVLGVSPFMLLDSELEANVQLQLFLAVAAFSTLVVAALANENAESLQRLIHSNRELEERVLERTASLTSSESRLKKMMETAQVGIAFANGRGALTEVNAALAELLDRSIVELESGNINWDTLLPELERERLAHDLVRLQTEGKVGPMELLFRRPDGSTVPTIFAASLLDNGEHVAFVVDQTEQKRHEEQIGLLMGEVNHRAKNILAVVQSVARQTKAASIPDFLDRFNERIRALATLQNLLVANRWKGAPLDTVIREQLAHFGDALDTRITIDGPHTVLSAPAAQTVALAIHELATNAAKYGALSNAAGRVVVAWERRPDDKLLLSWVESKGPQVQAPSHRGFGTLVVESMVRAIPGCSASAEYEATGFQWVLEGPISSLVSSSTNEASPGGSIGH
jgi:PAS domain S-box-containing protein